MGIRSVSAFIKREGHSTRLIWTGSSEGLCSDNELKEILELVKDVDLIGLSCLSEGSEKAKQVASYLKPLGKFIVWGGIYATLNPEDCSQYVDMVCRGEGEETLLDLINRLSEGKEWRDIPNGVYYKNGNLVTNPLRPLISDLDTLPVLDFSFSDEHHFNGNGFNRVTSFSDTTQPIMFVGSRGCYYRCTYCCNTKLKEIFKDAGRYVRKMSVSRYVEHVKALKKALPQAKHFYFIDEDFFARPVDEIEKFSETYRREIGMPFDVLASPLQTTQEKVDLLVDAGLWRVRMGVESGSERTKKEIYNRHMSNDKVKRAANAYSKHHNLVSCYFLIISNPYEEKEDLVDTIRLLCELPTPYIQQSFDLVFYPGSVLYERAVQDGIISGRYDSGHLLDYRGGLHYQEQTWKKKNLYLNGLLYLMGGKSTRGRLGALPRRVIPLLLRDRVIEFNNRHPLFIRFTIAMKTYFIQFRRRMVRIILMLIGDPQFVYNIKDYIKKGSLISAIKKKLMFSKA